MEATIVQDKTKHYPVLLKEIISIITPQYGGIHLFLRRSLVFLSS